MITAKELREKYLEFFKSKAHVILPSASLIPENDPTVLFTTAGMHSLVPYLMGAKHPAGQRLANCQKCIRTGDIEKVGDNRHLTFFEMLGNWSLGDYFKEEAIAWSWEFLTDKKWLNLDPQRLYVTVFMGDNNVAIDQESIEIWQKQFAKAGIKAKVCPYNQLITGNANLRIFPLPAKDNWWGPTGATGPCGHCTEIFYDINPASGKLQKTFNQEIEHGRVLEIWNNVFMQYHKTVAGKFELLEQKNVDTGMGLERTIAVLNKEQDVFANDLFVNICFKIENLSGKKYGANLEITHAMRLIADHLKAVTFIMADDKAVTPSNTNQGYVVRRLIRRAIRYGRQLGIKEESWTKEIAKVVAHDYAEIYPQLQKNINFVISQLKEEEVKFSKTLEQGLKKLEKMKPKFIPAVGVGSLSTKSGIIDYGLSGDDLFNLYATYGFPIELSIEEIKKIYKEFKAEKGIKIAIAELSKEDEERLLDQFHKSLKKHQELSRTASAGMFKGGLADASEATIKYHTAAHLMLAALKKVLGDQVVQKGSNITPERLRFDFSYTDKLTADQKQKVENLVNEAIAKNLPVSCREMTLDEAKQINAMGVFETKYGVKVKVYTIGSGDNIVSREICGGPHVEQTGVLGKFKIQKEESSSAGVRRIKAILE